MTQPVAIAIADMRRGTVTEILSPGDGDRAVLEAFAAAAPELFATDQLPWEAMLGDISRAATSAEFKEVVVMSPSTIYVARRRPALPSEVLIAIAPRFGRVGLILAEARSRLSAVDEVRL